MTVHFTSNRESMESYLIQLSNWLNSVDLTDAASYLREYLGDFSDFVVVQNWVEDLAYQERDNDPSNCPRLVDTILAIDSRLNSSPGKKLLKILHESRKNSVASVEWSSPVDEVPENMTPFWKTGCDAVDKLTGGGAGMVVCAGMPKVGKSLIALSSSVEAARAGFKTVYVNAEMSSGHLLRRFHNYMKKVDPIVGENLHIAHVGPGLTIDALYAEIKNFAIDDETEKILIILDSINRIVEFGCSADGSEDGYWKTLADWSAWAMNSRRASEGKISWLLISELNSQGSVKGRNLEYTADIVLRLQSSGVEDVVEIDVPYSRISKSGNIGMAFRDFSTGRFIVHDD
jgi:hypothetical protein